MMFTLWLRLAIELKAKALEHVVHSAEPISHNHHLGNLDRNGCLGTSIRTRNREVTQLGVENSKVICQSEMSLSQAKTM